MTLSLRVDKNFKNIGKVHMVFEIFFDLHWTFNVRKKTSWISIWTVSKQLHRATFQQFYKVVRRSE